MAHSYSQFGEDRVLLESFPNGYIGSYLDLGANHPVTDSNTFLLYEHGWRGVTVEPVPAMLRAHREQRPGDIQLGVAIDQTNGEAVFWIPDCTTVATLNGDRAHAMMATGTPTRMITVPTRTVGTMLSDLTEKAFLYHYLGWWKAPTWFGQVPDVLSIDVEGYELAALSSCPFRTGWLPSLIVIEACLPCTETPCHEHWEHILTGYGYCYQSTHGVNRIYRRTTQPVYPR